MTGLGAAVAGALVKLRFLVLLGWIAGVVWVVATVPALQGSTSGKLTSLVPSGSAALHAEQLSAKRFAFPLVSRTIVVVRNPGGLSLERQAHLVTLAARLSLRRLPAYSRIVGALPLPDRAGTAPFARHPGTTVLLYLYFRPSTSYADRVALARKLIRRQIGHRPGEYEGITGLVPASLEQEHLISSRLLWVALATLLVIAVAVGVRLRAVPAAILTVIGIVAAYLIADRIVGDMARSSGLTVPTQVEPVLVVLVLGVTSDYSIFFLARFRALLRSGHDPRQAAVTTIREVVPIVFTAGVTVAASTAALLIATPSFIRGFGPALAIAVLVAMIVTITFMPALLAIGGRRLFWPGFASGTADEPGRTAGGVRGRLRERFSSARLAARHPVIAIVLTMAIVLAAASGLREIRIGNEIVTDLPAGTTSQQAYNALRAGFAPGVLSPTLVVVTGAGVGHRVAALDRLQSELGSRPYVAQSLGPDQSLLRFGISASIWTTPNAARYVLFLRQDPLGSQAIAHVRDLRRSLPQLMRSAGLTKAHGIVGGDTALSADIVGATIGDLERVIPTMLGIIFLVFAISLRALVAPLYLVSTSALAAAAALGLEVYSLQDGLGYGQSTYYMVLTVAVMLVALGSDYNVFLVGRIWQQGRGRPIREAVIDAGAGAARSIATAAVVLVLSFVLLAIVPLRPFRESAFAMAAGLTIDAFVIRASLVPAMMVLVGASSAWPSHAFARAGSLAAAGTAPEQQARSARAASP